MPETLASSAAAPLDLPKNDVVDPAKLPYINECKALDLVRKLKMGASVRKDFDVTVTSKGQMTLPADVRDTLGIAPGDRLSLKVTEDGEIRMVKKTASYRDTIGLLGHLARNRTVEAAAETSSAIEAAMREQEERSRKPFDRTK